MSTESLVINPELNPESQEYIDSMATKGSAAVNGGVEPEAPVVIPEKPEGIPDKFYNAETGVVDYTALAKSYVELEKTKGKPVEPPKTKPEEATNDNAAKVVADAGLNMSELSKEYAETGELAEASYDALAKAGIPKEMVADYIAGVQAQVEVAKTQAYSITEGADGYKAMIEYAEANLSPEEISDYNLAVHSKDSRIRDAAVKGMWAKYGSETGNTGGDLVTNKTNSKVGDGTYQSRAEMMVDMNDKRYKTDPAFRAKVSSKIGNSNIF